MIDFENKLIGLLKHDIELKEFENNTVFKCGNPEEVAREFAKKKYSEQENNWLK